MQYAIETIGLTKRYPTTAHLEGHYHGGPSFGGILRSFRQTKGPFIEALRGVDLQVKKGEVFGLLGPNGAGKTTLIKVLCTLVIHDKGTALVNGIDVKSQPGEVLKNLQAVLPESRGFAWRLSGRQNLEFYALLYGLKEDAARRRIDYLLDITGLKDRADDGYQRYSTGMQRKLLLCRALLRDTPALLFDEPTTGLDPASAADFRRLLADRLARGEGKTIFLSTHNLAEAQEMCDRIAILDRGKITACDSPRNIRYTMSDEKVFHITFADALFAAGHEQMLNEIENVAGVHGATPEIDGGLLVAISIRTDKNLALSTILPFIEKGNLTIGDVHTEEPTLEEAFTAITRKQSRRT